MPSDAPAHQDPHTGHGVYLSGFARQGSAAFVVHETGYLPRGIPWHYPGVRSPYWRLYYNHTPGWYVRCDGRRWPLGPDRLVLIAEGVTFDCVGDEGVSHLWLHFSPLRHFATLPKEPWSLPAQPLLKAAVSGLVAAHRQSEGDRRLQRLYHASAALLHATFAEVEEPLYSPYPERLQQVLVLIQDAPQDDLSNAVLARRVAMSVEHFIRWFKTATGLSPAAYVRRSRVRLASQLLVLSDRSIEDIAAECGFANRYHLSRLFRAQLGCGPAAFRKRHVRV